MGVVGQRRVSEGRAYNRQLGFLGLAGRERTEYRLRDDIQRDHARWRKFGLSDITLKKRDSGISSVQSVGITPRIEDYQDAQIKKTIDERSRKRAFTTVLWAFDYVHTR
jgi:hypothetical protein